MYIKSNSHTGSRSITSKGLKILFQVIKTKVKKIKLDLLKVFFNNYYRNWKIRDKNIYIKRKEVTLTKEKEYINIFEPQNSK